MTGTRILKSFKEYLQKYRGRYQAANRINYVLAILFLFSLLLAKIGFPAPSYLIGTITLFIPSLNIVWTIESIGGKRIGTELLIPLILIIGPIVNSLFAYIHLVTIARSLISPETFLLSFAYLWLATYALLLLSVTIYKNKISIPSYKSLAFSLKKAWPVALAILILMAVNMILYRFIPEADGYKNLIAIKESIRQSRVAFPANRAIFYTFSLSLHYLTNIPIYWMYKILIPLIASLIVIPFYQISNKKFKSKLMASIFSLSPFLFPVVVLEILVTRPQTLFIISFTLSIYVLSKIIRQKNLTNTLIIWVLFLISLIGIKAHGFFILLVIINAVSALYYYRESIKKSPVTSLSLVATLTVLVYPWLRDLGIIAIASFSIRTISSFLSKITFDPWFVDNYINVDGSQMGWPGASSILYYGYNLGLAFPFILILSLIRRVKIKQYLTKYLPIFIGFCIFFFIAEILPRFGIAYLPDRAWLYVSIILAFLMIAITPKEISRYVYWTTVILGILSLLSSMVVTYAKQGWITPQEHKAAEFINNNTEENAAIITQGSSYTPLSYFSFGRRSVYPPTSFFMENNPESDNEYISNLPDIISRKSFYQNKTKELEKSTYTLIESIKDGDNPPDKEITQDIIKKTKLLEKYYEKIRNIEELNLDQDRPVYVMYSSNKFDGLYGKRSWWKSFNFYNANLNKFESPPYEKIYDKDGVLIWRYREDEN